MQIGAQMIKVAEKIECIEEGVMNEYPAAPGALRAVGTSHLCPACEIDYSSYWRACRPLD